MSHPSWLTPSSQDKLAEEHLHEAARQKILAEHARREYEALKARLDLGPPTPPVRSAC